MILFFSRIPPETVPEDIIEFVKPALKGFIFNKSECIKDIKIMILKDILLDKLEYHAFVTIEPEKIATRVNSKLNRKPINGKHIAVRGFVSRSWHTDSRVSMQKLHCDLIERRVSDRRRGYRMKVVENVTGTFKSRMVCI